VIVIGFGDLLMDHILDTQLEIIMIDVIIQYQQM